MSTLNTTQASDLFRDEPTSFIDVGAGEVACRTIGTGPDVLFVPGWPVSGATYRKVLPHFASEFTCHILDFPGTGSSRFNADTPISLEGHVSSLRIVVDALGLESFAAIGQDSGGMVLRHALGGDPRVRAMGLINTEQPIGVSAPFKRFLASRAIPGFERVLGWALGQPRVRRNKFLLGDTFVDRSMIDGEFDEFFLQPIRTSPKHRRAAAELLKSFNEDLVLSLASVHPRMTCPVHLVWGIADPFFPVKHARTMVGTFPNARLTEISGASLFPHEERPAEVAAALLPTLRDADISANT